MLQKNKFADIIHLDVVYNTFWKKITHSLNKLLYNLLRVFLHFNELNNKWI